MLKLCPLERTKSTEHLPTSLHKSWYEKQSGRNSIEHP